MALLVVLNISNTPARAWGLDGHRVVGMIADLLLANDRSGAAVTQLLEGAGLSEAATWADCAKGYCGRPLSKDERKYVEQNPQHATYHYTDVPIQRSRYQLGTAGTRDNDVVQVARQAVNVLRDRAPNDGPAAFDRKSALWVLAHMVGDLHQPLHVGAIYFADDCAEPVDPNVVASGEVNFGIDLSVVSTRGGNYLQLSKRENLHSYWDKGTVSGAMRLAGVRNKSITDFANSILAHPPQSWDTSGDTETWPEQWATEILPLANAALTRVEIGDGIHADNEDGGLKCTWPVIVNRDYSAWANEQALNQLAKAGFRLAAVIRATMQGQ